MYKTIIVSFLVGSAIGAIALAQPMSQPSASLLYKPLSDAATRACIFPSGGWTTIATDNVAGVASAQLNVWSRYVVQCGDDSRIAWGGSTVVADGSDGYITAEDWLEFITTPDTRYVSLLNINNDNTCWIHECK